jgi:hypothetical protein
MLAVAIWLFFCILVSLSQSPAQARFWFDQRFLGLTVMLAFFIIFVIQYTGHEKWLTKPLLTVIFAIPIVTQIIVETNSLHHLFIRKADFSRVGILMGLDAIQCGPLYWVHTVYSYSLALVGIGLIVWMSIRTFHSHREQALPMIIGVLPPLFTSVIDAFLLIPGQKQPLSPLGFAVMGLFFGDAILHHRMFDIVPAARDSVTDSLSDSMFVLDSHATIIDINPSHRYFTRGTSW